MKTLKVCILVSHASSPHHCSLQALSDTCTLFSQQKDSGAIGKQIEDGVRLMGRGAEHIKWPIHLEVVFDVTSVHLFSLVSVSLTQTCFCIHILVIISWFPYRRKEYLLINCGSISNKLELLYIVNTGFKGDCKGKSSG